MGGEEIEHGHFKYLGVVEVVINIAAIYAVKIYVVAKECSGSFKPRFDAVENKVKAVVGPIYKKIQGKPHEILLFIDKKLDEGVACVKSHTPEKVKEALWGAVEVVKQVPDFVLGVLLELHKSGFTETTKIYVNKYQPLAEEWGHVAWKHFLKLPYSVEAVHLVAPPTLFFARKFNTFLLTLKKQTPHVPLIQVLPCIPVHHFETIVVKREA